MDKPSKRNYIKEVGLGTIINYGGMALGYINIIVLLPALLEPSDIGVYQTILKTSTLFGGLILIGLTTTINKYLPVLYWKEFRIKTKKLVRLSLLLLFFSIGSIGLLYFAEIQFSDFPTELLYFPAIFILSFYFKSLILNLLRSSKKIALTSFLSEIVFRIAILIVCLWAIAQNGLELTTLLFVYLFSEAFVIIWGLISVRKSDIYHPKKPIPNTPRKEIIHYSKLSFLTAVGGALVSQIDILMIGGFAPNGMASVGIYSIAFFIGTVVEMPKRAIGSLALPLLSEAFKEKKAEKTKEILHQMALFQFAIGVPIFLCVALNLETLFLWMPNGQEYLAGFWVVIIIGLSKLVDLILGPTSEFISASDKYKFNFQVTIVLAILNLLLNLVFIPIYGILGAAIATTISICSFNLLKFVFIKKHFKATALSGNNLKVLFSGIITLAIGYFTTNFFASAVNGLILIALSSCCIFLIYLGLLWFFIPKSDFQLFLHHLKLKKQGANLQKQN